MTKFKYTKNLQPGEEGAMVYWRVLWALEDDPIASMLSERTLQGLAGAYQKGMTSREGVARFTPSGAKYYARDVIRVSPLSILNKDAIEYLGSVIEAAIFPEGVEE